MPTGALKKDKPQSSGGRTRPLVKQSPAMNRKNLRTWEIRLGLLHVVAFLGVIIGIMVCVFLLAFFHGHNAGFEAAARQSLENIARLPVDSDIATTEEQDAIEKQVYAALSAEDQVEVDGGETVPELANIPDVEEAPVVEEDGLAELDEALQKEEEAKLAEEFVVKEEDTIVEAPAAEDTKVVKGEAGLKIVGETGSVIVIDEDKPKAAKDATLDELLTDEEAAISQPKEAAAVEELLPEPAKPVVEEKPKKVEPKKVEPPKVEKKVVEPKIEEPKVAVVKQETPPAKPPVVEKPKVAEVPASVNQSAFIRVVVPKGWYAQVAAPGVLGDANALASRLKNSGFSVMIEKALVRGKVFYRVLVGPEQNKTMAKRLLDQVKREPYLKGEPFIRNVR